MEYVNTFASVTLELMGTTLRGYLMDDNTFQFIIKGKMQSFPDLKSVWYAFTDI